MINATISKLKEHGNLELLGMSYFNLFNGKGLSIICIIHKI